MGLLTLKVIHCPHPHLPQALLAQQLPDLLHLQAGDKALGILQHRPILLQVHMAHWMGGHAKGSSLLQGERGESQWARMVAVHEGVTGHGLKQSQHCLGLGSCSNREGQKADEQ